MEKFNSIAVSAPLAATAALVTAGAFFLPSVASAQLVGGGNAGGVGDLLVNVVEFINTIAIPFILALAFLAFVWGVFQYFIAGGANDDAKEKGKSLMVYAVAGFVLILAFWGIINLLATSTGLEDGAADVGAIKIEGPTPSN